MPRYRFLEWRDETGAIIGTTPAISLLIDRDKTLTAHYEEVPAPPTYALTIGTTVGGTTDPVPGTYESEEGTLINVLAIPDSGWNFDRWDLDGATYTTNPLSVLMDKDHTLTAYFSEIPPPPPETYKLNISTTVGGTTDPMPGVHEYDVGTVVRVTAIPEIGYNFDHWELDGMVRVDNPTDVLMDRDYTLLAIFSAVPPPSYVLTVDSEPIKNVPFAGDNQPGVTPASLTLPEGSYTVAMPSSVETAEGIYNFVSWEDGSTNPERSINLTSDLTIIATYEKPPPPPLEKGILDIHAFFGDEEVSANGRIIETRQAFTTPVSFELDPGVYTVFCRYRARAKVKYPTVIAGQTTRLDFQFRLPWGLALKFPDLAKTWGYPLLSRIEDFKRKKR